MSETTFSLVALDGGETGVWRGLPASHLVLPALGDPYDGWNDEAFWLARHREYRGLEWDRLDWRALRRTMAAAARALAKEPAAAPELTFTVPDLDERMFIEMWFGYGDPPVAVRIEGEGRYRVTYGQHRICALMDFPMSKRDRALMGLGEGGFLPEPPLPPKTLIPVLVRE